MAKFDEHWNFQEPAETRAVFEALKPSLATNQSLLLELLTQIARTHSLVGEFDQAHVILDEVEGEISAETPTAKIRYLLERGRAFRSSGKAEPSKPLFHEAFELSQQHGEDYYAVDAAHMIAIVVPPAEQLEWNLRAMKIAEASEEPRARKWLGSLYNNMGWTYHESGEFETALTLFQNGAVWHKEHGSLHTRLIAEWAVGRALRSLNRIEEAMAIQKQVLREREANQMPAGYVYEELGELLLSGGNSAEAAPHFAKAHAILNQDKWLQNNEPERLDRLLHLSKHA